MARDLTVAKIDEYLKSKKGGDVGDPNLNATRPKVWYGTGIPNIDYALGGGDGSLGGLPGGHVSEVYGKEAVGKTSLLYRIIANSQKAYPDKINLIFDYEHTTDKNYIQACGVVFDKARLRIFRPKTLEDGIELLALFLKTGQLGVACFDSLASMMPAREMEARSKDLHKVQVATKAKVMAEILRFLTAEIAGTESHVCFVNHEMANIVANPYQGGYNPPTVTPGGNALKYYSSMRIQLTFKGMVTVDDKLDFEGEEYKGSVGKKILLHVEKFKFGNPGARVQYEIIAGKGIDEIGPLIRAALARKLIKKGTGGVFTVTLPGCENIKIKGEDKFKSMIEGDSELKAVITQAIGLEPRSYSTDDDPEDHEEEVAALAEEVSWDIGTVDPE